MDDICPEFLKVVDVVGLPWLTPLYTSGLKMLTPSVRQTLGLWDIVWLSSWCTGPALYPVKDIKVCMGLCWVLLDLQPQGNLSAFYGRCDSSGFFRQSPPGRLSAECEPQWDLTAPKYGAVVLSQKQVKCPLRVRKELLQLTQFYKNLVIFARNWQTYWYNICNNADAVPVC